MSGLARHLLVILVVPVVVLASACGGGQDAQVHEFVVPKGTAERIARGEKVAIMPAEVHVKVGDTIKVRNEDVVSQTVGPYLVAAGDQFEVTYGSPGRFSGVCPLSEGERYEIVISE